MKEPDEVVAVQKIDKASYKRSLTAFLAGQVTQEYTSPGRYVRHIEGETSFVLFVRTIEQGLVAFHVKVSEVV